MAIEEDITFEPIGGYALLEPIEKKVTPGGIALPDGAECSEDPPQARVIKVGPGEESPETGHILKPDIQPGDVIYTMFPNYATPAGFTIKGKRYIIAQMKFICGREKRAA